MRTSTRTNTRTAGYQDPRYLQMWLVFDWPTPTDRVQVECAAGCGWTGRRARRWAAVKPCPQCAGPVLGRRPGCVGRTAGTGTVVQLAGWSRDGEGRAGQPGRVVRRS